MDIRHTLGNWLFAVRLIATAAWRGQRDWAVGVWKANPVRVSVAALVFVQIGRVIG